MPLQTSVVSNYTSNRARTASSRTSHSIGMEFSSASPTGLTAFHTSLSAHFVSRNHSCRPSMSPIRLERTGITHIIQLNIVMDLEDHWLSMIPKTLWHIYTMSMMVSFHPFSDHVLTCNPNRKYRYHALRLVSISRRTERFVLTWI